MTADEAVREGFHCISENIPADRLNDVLHKFGTVAFDSRPLAGIDALVGNRVRTKLVCTHNRAKTDSFVLVTFCYAQLFYQEGDFRRTIEILEPIVLDYQSFSYTPKLISCFNLMGVGSRFTVVLPFALAPEAEAPHPETISAADLTGLRLLLAEDNELNMEIAEFFLKEKGAQFQKVKNFTFLKLCRLHILNGYGII